MMLTGSEIICECLIEQGVDTVFGYPGGTILNVYDALYRYQDKINHVLTSHEQGASHAADGYARATGKVGVCMATSGPGATNLVTGIATAYMDSTPLVAITANVGVEILGRDSFQEIDITGVTMPITKHNFIVKDIKDLVPTIRKAFYIAKEGRPGPVLVDVTKNVTAEKMEFEPLQPKVIEPKTETYTVEDLDQAIEIIKESEKPFIFAGGGVISSGASQELKEFAEKGNKDGLLLFHENYFQHNILEAGAHWVDSPWRSSNNINQTGFPEPAPFAGDKRIFVADMFYDISHPVRRELHRQYIRQCLNNFADNSNVIQLTSAEFTGPLLFVQFLFDVIAEWETETGKKAKVALSTTKDVQDAILADPKRAAVVDIIDIRYWHYKTDGIFAPEGGKNMAPRQHMRKMKVGKVTFTEAYKAVNEYRQKFPQKAVTFYAQNYPAMGWAVFMAGGSCPVIPCTDKAFLKDAAAMEVEETNTDEYKKMVKSDIGSIIYSKSETEIPVQLSSGKYVLKYIHPASGKIETINKSLKINGLYNLKVPDKKEGIYWFHKL